MAQHRVSMGTWIRRVCIQSLMFAVVFGFWPHSVQAGPWNQPRGAYYGKIFSSLYRTNSHLIASPSGVQYIDGAYVGWSTGIYDEYGLNDRLTLSATLPFVYALNFDGDQTYRNTGLGDILLGIQTPLLNGPPLATKLVVKIPGYSNQAIIPGGVPVNQPFLGDGQVDVMAFLSAGHSFWPKSFYTYGEVGLNYRTQVGPGPIPGQNFRNAFVFNGHFGYASENWRASIQSQGQVAVDPNAPGNKSWVALSLSGAKHLSGAWWIGLDAEQELWTKWGAEEAPIGQRVGFSISFEGGK